MGEKSQYTSEESGYYDRSYLQDDGPRGEEIAEILEEEIVEQSSSEEPYQPPRLPEGRVPRIVAPDDEFGEDVTDEEIGIDSHDTDDLSGEERAMHFVEDEPVDDDSAEVAYDPDLTVEARDALKDF